jgi:hypothetical protein
MELIKGSLNLLFQCHDRSRMDYLSRGVHNGQDIMNLMKVYLDAVLKP